MARLSVEDKYAVKISITGLFNLIGNEGNIIMAGYGKCKCGLRPEATYPTGPAVGLTGAATPCKHNHMTMKGTS